MPDFNIDSFTSNLKKGGALASLFECELLGGKGNVLTSSVDTFKFLCKGVIFPASTIDSAAVTYMGRSINIPSNRASQQVTTTIYNDENMELRMYLESWMERLNSHKSNTREAGFSAINSYTGTLKVKQKAKDGGSSSVSYEFVDCWPSSTGEITLSWDTNDIQTYDVVWEYSYFKNATSGAGFS